MHNVGLKAGATKRFTTFKAEPSGTPANKLISYFPALLPPKLLEIAPLRNSWLTRRIDVVLLCPDFLSHQQSYCENPCALRVEPHPIQTGSKRSRTRYASAVKGHLRCFNRFWTRPAT